MHSTMRHARQRDLRGTADSISYRIRSDPEKVYAIKSKYSTYVEFFSNLNFLGNQNESERKIGTV